jgi:hypothetical protein
LLLNLNVSLSWCFFLWTADTGFFNLPFMPCLLPPARGVHLWEYGAYWALKKTGLRLAHYAPIVRGIKCSQVRQSSELTYLFGKTLVPDFKWKMLFKTIFWLLAYIFSLCGAGHFIIST